MATKHQKTDQIMKVSIDGRTTTLNALDFLEFAFDVKMGKRKALKEIEK